MRQANENLESRVKDRTASLELAKQTLEAEIVERQKAETEVRRATEDLNRAQAVAQVGSWRLNVQRNELVWSDENWRIFGVPVGTPLTYETFLATVHPDDRDSVDRKWKACLRGEPYDIEHRIVVGDRIKWVRERAELELDAKGALCGGFGTTQDISRIKQAEAALVRAHGELEQKVLERTARLHRANQLLAAEIRVRRATELRLKEAEFRYRTVADFTYAWEYWKTPEGKLRYCSPSCERITGYLAQELVSNPELLQELILPEDQAAWDAHECLVLSGRPAAEIEFRIRHKQGDIRWIEHTCRIVTSSQNEFLGVRASNRDITQRKQGEMETQRLREELNRFSRITTAGKLAASIAHELTQPLGAMLCNAQAADSWMNREPLQLTDAREALADIQADCRRAGAVIQQLRSLYQKGELEHGPLQLNDVISETFELIHSELVFKHVKLRLDLVPELWRIQGNPVELQQVILNLAMNAIEAMTLQGSGERHLVVRTWRETPAMVRASISDSGPGLTQAQLNRVFEPFYSTKASGMGMGLAICLSILDEHRGKLWAENKTESGATFHLSLPAIPEGPS